MALLAAFSDGRLPTRYRLGGAVDARTGTPGCGSYEEADDRDDVVDPESRLDLAFILANAALNVASVSVEFCLENGCALIVLVVEDPIDASEADELCGTDLAGGGVVDLNDTSLNKGLGLSEALKSSASAVTTCLKGDLSGIGGGGGDTSTRSGRAVGTLPIFGGAGGGGRSSSLGGRGGRLGGAGARRGSSKTGRARKGALSPGFVGLLPVTFTPWSVPR